MTQLTTTPNVKPQVLNYRQMPLNDLLSQLVRNQDKAALEEFHNNRTLFQFHEKSKLLFAQFISALRDGCLNTNYGRQADEAYDMTLDKFSRLPEEGKGINCLLYFKAALNLLPPNTNPLQSESNLTQILQRMVFRHFKLSLLETQRKGTWTRYIWKVEGENIPLLLPKELSGSERRKWLENTFTKVQTNRPGERHRLQMAINTHFQKVSLKSIEDPVIEQSQSDLPWIICDQLSIDGLAKTLAHEKSDRLFEQRPSIRAMGRKNLKLLIKDIFESVDDKTNRDGAIARKYGLSKASFSRFAGSHWTYPNTPDLWKNLANLIAHHPVMKEAAQYHGVWNTVKAINDHEPSIA